MAEDEMVRECSLNLSKLWEIMKDGGAWRAVVYEVTKSQTSLSH